MKYLFYCLTNADTPIYKSNFKQFNIIFCYNITLLYDGYFIYTCKILANNPYQKISKNQYKNVENM